MRALGVAVLAVLLAACHQGESISLAPTPGQRPPDIGPAATLILDVITGVGSSATVTVRVRDANGRGVGGATVQLATTAGEVEPASVVTKPDGTATAVLFSNQKATVTASIGDLRAEPISVDGQSRFRVMLGVGPTGTRGQAVAFTLRVEPLDRDLIFGAASVAFGDGTATAPRIAPDALTATLSHIYYQPGAFTITGRVTDSRGLTEQASATVAM